MQSLPDPAVVVLVGPAGSGKSHFARTHYRAAEIVSSDDLRGVVGSGAHDLAADRRGVRDPRARRRGPPLAWADHRRRHPRPGPRPPPGLARRRQGRRAPGRRRRHRHPARGDPAPQRGSRVRRPGDRTRHPAQAVPRGPRRRAAGRGLGRRARRQARLPRGRRDTDLGGHTHRRPALVAGADRHAPALPLPVGRGTGRVAAVDGAGRGRGRLRRTGGDGPPHPDPAGGPGLGADPRALGDSRPGGRPGHAASPRHARLPHHLPAGGHHGQGRGDARRADGRPGVRRGRRRMVAPRARGVRPAVPAGARAAGRPRVGHRDDAGTVGGGHQGLRRGAGQPAGDHVLPATGGVDPGDRRRERRATYVAHRGPPGRRLQPALGRRAARPQARRAAAAPRRGRAAARRARGHRARPARHRPGPRRRVGPGRAASWAHSGGDVRAEEARRHRRPAARPVGRTRRARRRDGVRVHAGPGRSGRRAGAERLDATT